MQREEKYLNRETLNGIWLVHLQAENASQQAEAWVIIILFGKT